MLEAEQGMITTYVKLLTTNLRLLPRGDREATMFGFDGTKTDQAV
jgi:hypothetical protein